MFGSRARDDLRGGDLDLFVEVEPGDASIANEQRLRDLIAPALDDLRTDIILHERGGAVTPIERIALRDGVSLWAWKRPAWPGRPCWPHRLAPAASSGHFETLAPPPSCQSRRSRHRAACGARLRLVPSACGPATRRRTSSAVSARRSEIEQ